MTKILNLENVAFPDTPLNVTRNKKDSVSNIGTEPVTITKIDSDESVFVPESVETPKLYPKRASANIYVDNDGSLVNSSGEYFTTEPSIGSQIGTSDANGNITIDLSGLFVSIVDSDNSTNLVDSDNTTYIIDSGV